MPSRHRHSDKKHSRRHEESTTKTSERSRSRSRSCDKGECKTKCHQAVKVDVDNKPRVWCKERDHGDCKFDVAVDIKTHPSCDVKHVYSEKLSRCRERCVFAVKLDCDYECKAKILNKPHFKPRVFDLFIENQTKQSCEALGGEGCH